MTDRLVECVPNFSEGRDKAVIDAIARAISGVSGVRLLDVDTGADTNCTVYTFVGEPEAVSEAAFRAAVACGYVRVTGIDRRTVVVSSDCAYRRLVVLHIRLHGNRYGGAHG